MPAGPIRATLFSDAGCPWAYSAAPALRVLEWRYGDQLEWRLVLIGLTERAECTPARLHRSAARVVKRGIAAGMPFSPERARVIGTGRACAAVAAARIVQLGRSGRSSARLIRLVHDDAAAGRGCRDPGGTRQRAGIDAAIVGMLERRGVVEAYERDRTETRRAAGSPTEFQGKSAATDGPVRYTAPSVIFERDGSRLEAGGFQPVEAYDVLLANLDPTLHREPPPETPQPLLERFPFGLTTREVAACLTRGNDATDRTAAELALLELVAGGTARRTPLGGDALWSPV
jgi:hypothetical protein